MFSTSRWLPFEKPLQDVDEQIRKLEEYTATHGIDRSDKIREMREEYQALCIQIFSNLSAWDKTLLARHPNRPYTLDYIRMIFEDFIELHGDRRFGDDPAMIAGIARLDTQTVVVIGQQKGRDVKERTYRNFGSAKPEGYRKAERMMDIAERHGLPLVSFIDTPAAEGRLEAEERGISEAIAASMAHMSRLRIPVYAIVTGEGGSGGAIAIGVANYVAMLEHSIYSIMPPEGCAAILDTFGRDGSRGYQAAEALKLTAQMNQELGLVDEVIPEPFGGAHREPQEMAARIRTAMIARLDILRQESPEALVEQRYRRFRVMGQFTTG